jgi:hypothetical protein
VGLEIVVSIDIKIGMREAMKKCILVVANEFLNAIVRESALKTNALARKIIYYAIRDVTVAILNAKINEIYFKFDLYYYFFNFLY